MCQPDGDHLDFVLEMAREGIELDEEDAPVELESDLAYDVLDVFWRLHNARGSGGFGPTAISYQDLVAFVQMTGEQLGPWLVDQIRSLDNLFLSAIAESHKRKQ